MAEIGYPGFEAVAWIGLFTTAGTPPEIIDRLNAEVNEIIQNRDVVARLDEQAMTPVGGTPAAFAAFISAEVKRWKEAARIAKVTMEQ